MYCCRPLCVFCVFGSPLKETVRQGSWPEFSTTVDGQRQADRQLNRTWCWTVDASRALHAVRGAEHDWQPAFYFLFFRKKGSLTKWLYRGRCLLGSISDKLTIALVLSGHEVQRLNLYTSAGQKATHNSPSMQPLATFKQVCAQGFAAAAAFPASDLSCRHVERQIGMVGRVGRSQKRPILSKVTTAMSRSFFKYSGPDQTFVYGKDNYAKFSTSIGPEGSLCVEACRQI